MFGWFQSWKLWIVIAILILIIVWLLRNLEWRKEKKRRRHPRSPRDHVVSDDETSLTEMSEDGSIQSVSFSRPLPKQFQPSPERRKVRPEQTNVEWKEEQTEVEWQIPEEILNPVRPQSERKETAKYSEGERLCKEAAEKIYGVTFHHSVWPSWLRNPETGKPIELDLYNEDLKIAIEYHGRQHYEYIPHFHRNGPHEYESQRRRDNYKLDICDENGVYVITVPHYLPNDKIEAWIRYHDPSAVMMREQRKTQLNK
jgi:hypothetical protein